jgi:hypothetical protein
LTKDKWNDVEVTIPEDIQPVGDKPGVIVTPLHRIGIQIKTDGNYTGSVWVDNITVGK